LQLSFITKSFLVLLFNQILTLNSIPKDWKCAVLTPLFKGKGSRSECDNYRGISILSPIAKLFEIILSKQLNSYLKTPIL